MRRQLRFDRPGLLALEPQAWGLSFCEAAPAPEAFVDMGGVAVVDIRGPLTHHAEWFFDSYDAIQERVAAAFDSSCKAVLLRIDSPGGDVAGCFETAASLRELAQGSGKPLYAYADGCAASAAYALASAAEQIWLPATARVGSVGVITSIVDQTAMDRAYGLAYAVIASGSRKTDGHPHVPVSEGAIASVQGQVNELAELFFLQVAGRRPLTVDAVRAHQAATFIGARAVEAGLADGVATFDELLAMVASGGKTTPRLRAAEDKTMTFEEMLAALKKAAEGDGDDADKARKMLKAIEGDDDEKKDDDSAEDEKKDDESDSAEDEKKDDDSAEDEKEGDKAASGVELAAMVQRLSAKLTGIEKKQADTERASLLASRPDLAPELVSVLTKKDKAGAFLTPLATVREICKGVPRTTTKKDPAAAAKVATTAGAGQSGALGGGVTRASAHADELDRAFGLEAPKPPIRREGTKLILGAMTPDEARKHLETKKAVG